MSSTVFTRTPPGLSNQAAFLGVDLIVFTEGGTRTLSLQEVENGLDNGENGDTAFWQAVIEHHSPKDKRIYVKSVGSKTTVKAIAVLVAVGQVIKVVAALDRDLDVYRGTLIVHPNILYTRGYSWENDVWIEQALIAIFNSLSHNRSERDQARIEVASFFADLEKCFRSAVRIDRSLATANRAVLPRDQLEDIVRPSPPHRPTLLRKDLATLIRASRLANMGTRRHHHPGGILDDLHGHTLAKAALSLIRNILESTSQMRVSNAVLTSLAISEFLRGVSNNRLAYYSAPVQQIIW